MELKRVSDLFWKVSPNLFFLSAFLGAVVGIAYAMLIPILMYAIGTPANEENGIDVAAWSMFDSPTAELAKLFLLVSLMIVALKAVSASLSMYLANRASMQHRLALYRKILRLDYVQFERIGRSRLINLLNIDIPSVTGAAMGLPQLWTSSVTAIAVMGYLWNLNPRVFAVVFCCLCVAVVTYQSPLLFAMRFFRRARVDYDRIQEGVTGLIYGAKELRLNRVRAERFFDQDLLLPESSWLKSNVKGYGVSSAIQSYGEVFSFLVVGIVVFQSRYALRLTPGELHSVALALLTLAGPFGTILNVSNQIRQGKISLHKLQHFYGELSDQDDAPAPAAIGSDWRSIVVRDVSFAYTDRQNEFSVKGVNLEIARGEVTFLVGGNGSGKSTLGKCLAFLYAPTDGEIRIGDTRINAGNVQAARQLVSAIFPDFHLFKKLYGQSNPETRALVAKYLSYLELDHKVTMDDDAFSTTSLSDGQRKRLALLVMLMDDRDICIFDEWAADQDPRFKDIFYTTILDELKRRDKAVIVISHDDRYFGHADQIISMEDGKVAGRSREPHKHLPLAAHA